MKATHKKRIAMIGYQSIPLEPGQFIFGLKIAMEELPLSYQKIRTCLDKLKNLGNITIKATNKFSIITVCNWELYVAEKYEPNNQSNKQITNKQQTNNKQITTDKNVNNEKNVKECKETSPKGDKEKLSLKSLFEKYEGDFTEEELKLKQDFFEHWTAKNEGGQKELWEMQKVFDIKRRFRTWIRNEAKWEGKKPKISATDRLKKFKQRKE